MNDPRDLLLAQSSLAQQKCRVLMLRLALDITSQLPDLLTDAGETFVVRQSQ